MRHTKSSFALALGLTAVLAGEATAAPVMTLTSPDIRPGGVIAPAQIYRDCGGRNLSPRLGWSPAPAGTRSLVLTMIDEDARPAGFTHWVVVDLPPGANGVARGAATLPAPARSLANDFGEPGYGGPCPPVGSRPHHYRFTIWALPTPTSGLTAGAGPGAITASLARRALASGRLVGIVTR